MQCTQIERLKNDSRELDHYIFRLKKKGKHSLVHKLSTKREFLNQTIKEYDEKFDYIQLA